MIEVHRSDLSKVFDVVEAAYRHHSTRDASNAALHLARETRLSPLTSELGAALDRLKALIELPERPTGEAEARRSAPPYRSYQLKVPRGHWDLKDYIFHPDILPKTPTGEAP